MFDRQIKMIEDQCQYYRNIVWKLRDEELNRLDSQTCIFLQTLSEFDFSVFPINLQPNVLLIQSQIAALHRAYQIEDTAGRSSLLLSIAEESDRTKAADYITKALQKNQNSFAKKICFDVTELILMSLLLQMKEIDQTLHYLENQHLLLHDVHMLKRANILEHQAKAKLNAAKLMMGEIRMLLDNTRVQAEEAIHCLNEAKIAQATATSRIVAPSSDMHFQAMEIVNEGRISNNRDIISADFVSPDAASQDSQLKAAEAAQIEEMTQELNGLTRTTLDSIYKTSTCSSTMWQSASRPPRRQVDDQRTGYECNIS